MHHPFGHPDELVTGIDLPSIRLQTSYPTVCIRTNTSQELPRRLVQLSPEFAMQTNLWLMVDETRRDPCRVPGPDPFIIDGPQELTNYQRGDEYYERCLAGYRITVAHGLLVRFICTFTNSSVKLELFQGGLGHETPSLKGENPNSLRRSTASFWSIFWMRRSNMQMILRS